MRNLKLSLSLLIAVVAVGFTVASKANYLGKRVITDCFEVLEVRATSTGAISVLDDALTNAQANALKAAKPYIVTATNVIPTAQCPDTDIFCCAKVVETSNTAAAQIDLGEGLKRYQVAQLFYKN